MIDEWDKESHESIMTNTKELLARLDAGPEYCTGPEWEAAIKAAAAKIRELLEDAKGNERVVKAGADQIRQLEAHTPTQWAYDQACKALHKHKDRADKMQAVVDAAIRWSEADDAEGRALLRKALKDLG